MIDSTLNEIVDFFSKQGALLAAEMLPRSVTAEVKLFKVFFTLRGSVTCSNHGIVEYVVGKGSNFFESSASRSYSRLCDMPFSNGASAATEIKDS